MIRTAAFLTLLSIAGAASAANWISFANCGEPGSLRMYQYDAASVRTAGSEVAVRIRGDYSQHKRMRAKEAQVLWHVNCADRTFVETSRKDFSAKHRVLANYRQPTRTMSIIPGSVPDKLFEKVCA
jgi:hypothetical protein